MTAAGKPADMRDLDRVRDQAQPLICMKRCGNMIDYSSRQSIARTARNIFDRSV